MTEPQPRTPPAAPHRDDVDDGAGLLDHLPSIWRHRWFVVASSVLVGVLTVVLTGSGPPAYQAVTRLIATSSKVGDVQGLTVSIATLRGLVDNQTLAAKVVADFGLTKSPYDLSPQRFLRGNVSITNPRDTSVIEIRVTMGDAELAARVANGMADGAVESARQLSREETVTAQDVLKTERDAAERRLREAEERLLVFKKQSQIDVQRRDVDVLLGQRRDLANLMVDVEVERARLATAEQELSRQERVRDERRVVDAGGTLGSGTTAGGTAKIDTTAGASARTGTAAGSGAGSGTSAGSGTGTRTGSEGLRIRPEALDPYVNPVYEMLDQQVAESRTRLAGLERQRAEISKNVSLSANQLAQVTRLYSTEAEVGRLETEYGIAKRTYEDVSVRYEQARLQVTGRSPQLQVLDRALTPEEPLPRNRLRNLAGGLAVGLLVSCAMAVAFETFRKGRARRPAAG